MVNNGFKKVFKEIITNKCKEYNLWQSIIDVSKQERLFYIYDDKYNCKATVKVYLTSKDVHISGSNDKEKETNICNRPYDCLCTYMQLNKAYEIICKIFEEIKEG